VADVRVLFKDAGRKVKHLLPWTKFPMKANVWSLYDRDKIQSAGQDWLRRDANEQNDNVYVFKKTGEEILVPAAGVEDKNSSVNLVQVGEGEYRFAQVKLDEESKDLIFHLYDDEQMKFLFAKKTIDFAWRYSEETPWWKSAVFLVFVFGITLAIMNFIQSSNTAALHDQLGRLTTSMGLNTQAINQLINNVGGVVSP